MPGIGSPTWVAELDAALRTLAAVEVADIVVQQELTDTGAAWHVVVEGGTAGARPGRHPDPDVTFTQASATAEAINAGALSAQTAFIDGRLRVRGAVDRLRDIAAVLGGLREVPADARS